MIRVIVGNFTPQQIAAFKKAGKIAMKKRREFLKQISQKNPPLKIGRTK